MFPGLTTKLSEASAEVASTTTITVASDITIISGTEAIETIIGQFGGGFSGIAVLIPTAAFTTVTTGNVAIASTAVAGKALIMVFVKSTGKWYPSY